MKKAVIYARVSDESQIKNNSLAQQIQSCTEYAKRNEFEIIQVFREEGVSAKHTHTRAELQKLMAFCSKRKDIDAVIVYQIDRWTRNAQEGLVAEGLLVGYGTCLHSVTENIERNPTGNFIKTVLMASAQMRNELKSECVKDNMKKMFREGRWCWKTPDGYKRPFNTKEENKGLPPILDKPVAEIILVLFIEAGKNIMSRQQLADMCNEMEFEKYTGTKMTAKRIERIIKNTFYYGEMYAKKWNEYAWGIHEPLIDKPIWEKANHALFHKKKKHNFQDNKIYPLKGTIFCDKCMRPMSSSNPTGRPGTYLHYMCSVCRKSINIEIVHKQFMELLSKIEPDEDVMLLFNEMVKSEWDKVNQIVVTQIKRIDRQIEILEQELKLAVKAKDSGDYPLDFAQSEIDRIKGELIVKRIARSDLKIEEYSAEKVTKFFEYFIKNLDRLWNIVDLPKKQALQNVIYPNGITTYAGEIRTAQLSPLFKQIEEFNEAVRQNVTPPGFEPGLPG